MGGRQEKRSKVGKVGGVSLICYLLLRKVLRTHSINWAMGSRWEEFVSFKLYIKNKNKFFISFFSDLILLNFQHLSNTYTIIGNLFFFFHKANF